MFSSKSDILLNKVSSTLDVTRAVFCIIGTIKTFARFRVLPNCVYNHKPCL